jgi:hypothetical protein
VHHRAHVEIEAVLGELSRDLEAIPLDAPVMTAKPFASLIHCG